MYSLSFGYRPEIDVKSSSLVRTVIIRNASFHEEVRGVESVGTYPTFSFLKYGRGWKFKSPTFARTCPDLGYEIRRVLKSLIRMGVGFISKRFEIEDD